MDGYERLKKQLQKLGREGADLSLTWEEKRDWAVGNAKLSWTPAQVALYEKGEDLRKVAEGVWAGIDSANHWGDGRSDAFAALHRALRKAAGLDYEEAFNDLVEHHAWLLDRTAWLQKRCVWYSRHMDECAREKADGAEEKA